MPYWIAYNGEEQSGRWAAAIVLAEGEDEARSAAYGAFLEHGRSIWSCEGKARRFSIIDWIELWDGPAPRHAPAIIAVGPQGEFELLAEIRAE